MSSRNSLWFFAALAVLGAVAVTVPLIYSLSLQLRPEKVAANRALWQAHGPRDYDLDYVVREAPDVPGEECHVTVRGGRVATATCDGRTPDEPVLTIDAIFDLMDRALAADRAAGRRNYAVADFDPHDGHPTRYVRQDKARGERLEITTRVRPAGGRR